MALTEIDPDAPVAMRPGLGRRELLTLTSALMAMMALGLDLMLPAFDEIREAFDLGAGSPETGKIITVYFMGLAVAQLVWGPLADRFGRKWVLYLGALIYVGGALGSALAPSFEFLLLSRFVWGIGAAASRVVAIAIVRDCFEGSRMAAAMSQVMAVFMLVPVLAPSLGSAMLTVLSWRSLFVFCVVFGIAVTLWSVRLGETLRPEHRRPFDVANTWKGYVEVSRTRITAGYTISTIFLQGVFTTYLASSELMIGEVFDREAQFPIIFGAIAVLFAVAAIVNGRIVERVGVHRLVGLTFAVVIPLTIVSLAVSVAADGRPEFWIYMPLLGVTLGSFMFLMPNLNSAALTPVGHLAGTASAWSGAVRMAGGAVLGTIVSSRITDSITPFAGGMVVLCICSWVSVVVVRHRSPSVTVADVTEPATARV